MNKKNIICTSDSTSSKLAFLAEEKESARLKLAVTARQLAEVAREKEDIRKKLAVVDKQLAVTAKEKEIIRSKLAVTAKKLAKTAKEKESARLKLAVTARQLAEVAREKEDIRKKLAVVDKQLAVTAKEKEDSQKAALNVLEDLIIEKSKVEIAKVKEEAVLLSIGDGLIATDEKGNITLVNKTAEKLLGIKSEEVIGKVFYKVIDIEDEKGASIPLEKRPMNMALENTTTTTTTTTGSTYCYVRKDKTKFSVAITVTPIILDGKIIGTNEVFRDITKEKEIDKTKTEFVSLASHQLRTPLTAISWYTEMILKGDVGKVIPSQKKYLDNIYSGNQRMIELVNTLLDVSRIELGTFMVKPEPTYIIALAQSVLEEQKPKIENKKLIIIEKFSKDIPAFSTDPKLLRMVFQNLLANSVEYTPPGGKIEFAISLDNKDILIKVSDTGYGIPKNQQNQIFTKLFRADNVRAKDTDGTGLGLYIVKSIIEHSGGKIWFKSKENEGTTFYITLPLSGMRKKEGSKQLS